MGVRTKMNHFYFDALPVVDDGDVFHFPKGKKIVLFEAFSGIGMQAEGLKIWEIPYEVVGVSEVDVNALISYSKIHKGVTDELIQQFVEGISLSKEEMLEQLHACGVGYDFAKGKQTLTEDTALSRVKRAYAAHFFCTNYGDISKIKAKDLPAEIDIFTYSFPCQDLSMMGKRRGMEQGETRSGLVFEVLRLAQECIDLGKPIRVFIMENVEGILSNSFIKAFGMIQDEWSDMGYSSAFTLAKASEYGVPQARPRVYMVSIYSDVEAGEPRYNFVFPHGTELETRVCDLLDWDDVDEKRYMSMKTFKGFSTFKSFNGFMRMLVFYPVNPFCKRVMPTFTTRVGNSSNDGYILEPLGGWDKDDSVLMNFDYREATRKLWAEQGISISGIRARVANGTYGDDWEMFNEIAWGAMNLREEDGRVVFTLQGYDFTLRYLTAREVFRLMTVTDDSFDKLDDIVDSAKFKQAGNGLIGIYFGAIVNQLLHPDDRRDFLDKDSRFWIDKVVTKKGG